MSEIPEIQGWLDPAAEALYQEMVDKAEDGAVFIEVGAWIGRSTLTFASMIRDSGKQIKLYVIDTWEGSEEELHYQLRNRYKEEIGRDLWGIFLNNVLATRLEDYITPLRMRSDQALELFGPDRPLGMVDFIYLDGSHQYQDVLSDCRHAERIIKDDGVIAGDDFNWPDVNQAVLEVFKVTSPNHRMWQVAGEKRTRAER